MYITTDIHDEVFMLEDIFDGAFADTLKRIFVPCKRVVSENKCENSKNIPGNRVIRNFVAADFEECSVNEGGFLLLDFGKEMSGGVKIVTSVMPGVFETAQNDTQYNKTLTARDLVRAIDALPAY